MLSFKKIGVLSLLLSAGLLLGLAINGNKASQQSVREAKATEAWAEEIYATNLVIGYAKVVKADATADYATSESGRYSYFVRHGYLTNNKIKKYDSVTTNGSTNATFSSNTATDASCIHWQFKINGGKLAEDTEDGVILGITANETMSYSIDTMTFKGYPNSGKANTYIKRSGSSVYTNVQSIVIENTSTEYSQSQVVLYQGDTVYFEYIQLYGEGNIQSTSGSGMPTFKMAEAQIERTINTSDIARDYYNNALASDATADYARDASQVFDIAVRHGRLDTKVIEKFDKITAANATSIDYAQTSDTENTHAAITYGRNIWTANNDGVIYVIKALEDITFSSTPATFDLGWFGFYLNYYLLESGKSTLITIAKETYAAGSTDPTAAVAPIKLSVGDIMYFEVRYAWSSNPRRSIQDNSDLGHVPTFVVSKTNIASVPVEANTFMAKFMKLAAISTDTEGTGQCITGGWYTSAKAAFNTMSEDARELFLTDAAYADGAARLRKWAAANGEEINASNLLAPISSNRFSALNLNNNSTIVLIVVIAVSISTIALMAFVLLSRKRKHL